MKTLQEKFEDAFQDHVDTHGTGDVEYTTAEAWARMGWDACLQMIREEGVESRMEDAMRELKVLSDTHPSAFRKVAERLEKTL